MGRREGERNGGEGERNGGEGGREGRRREEGEEEQREEGVQE